MKNPFFAARRPDRKASAAGETATKACPHEESRPKKTSWIGQKPFNAFVLDQMRQGASEDDETIQMVGTRLYVGLNDAQTKKQMFETEQYMDQLKALCFTYHVPFSVGIEEGGYFHEDGEYVEEKTLVLTLIDAQKDTIRNIAKDLRALFRQESVLITEDDVKGFYIV